MIFDLSQGVVHTGYYVHMGNAWLISGCMAKFPEETIAFFRNNTLDHKTHNKAIQKSRESFRVSKEHKEIINALKKKVAWIWQMDIYSRIFIPLMPFHRCGVRCCRGALGPDVLFPFSFP